MGAMLDAAPTVDAVDGGAKRTGPAAIRARGLRKFYGTDDGPFQALTDLTLNVADGEVVSIPVTSGCHKAALRKCIAGLEGFNAGSTYVCGGPGWPPPEGIVIVYQHNQLIVWQSVLNNVPVGIDPPELKRGHSRLRAEVLMASFGLSDYLHRDPWEISGGMCQRAAICQIKSEPLKGQISISPLLRFRYGDGTADRLAEEMRPGDGDG